MSKTYIQLARTGDILGILPLLYTEAQQGNRCKLMIGGEYQSLLTGCSYLDPIVFSGQPWELGGAYELASRTNGGEVIVTQVNGPRDFIEKHAQERTGQKVSTTDSFIKESWKVAGKLDLWKTQPPLVFDRRDAAREKALLQKYLPKKTKGASRLLLVALGGNTHPFPYAPLLQELIELKLTTGWRVLNLGDVQAECFYDVLGLYEQADALIASDSAPLHLAHATPGLPVLALINDKPNYWHGSPWRPNHVVHCRYEDFAARALDLFDVLEGIEDRQRDLAPHTGTRFYLCWNRAEERNENAEWGAKVTWAQDRLMPLWIDRGANGKDSTLLGDVERHPFLRGVLQLALMRLQPQDVLILVRPTTAVKPKLTELVAGKMPCYAHRLAGGHFHPAVDLFAAPRAFWETIFPVLPDLVMGRDHLWSRLLMEIFKENGGQEIRGVCWCEPLAPRVKWQEIAPPRLAHNKSIADDWLTAHGLVDLFPRIGKQVHHYPLNSDSLPLNAYNPSICRSGQQIWMTYRFHTFGGLNSALGISEIEPHGNAVRGERLPIQGHSVEDAKFFRFQGQNWLSWIESDYSGQAYPNAVVKIGQLTDDWQVLKQLQPDWGKNDWTGLEKNWVFWDRNDSLMAIYRTDPRQEIIQIDPATGRVVEQWISNPPQWPWGPIKGGFIAGKLEGKLLRFFHSTLDNEPGLWRRRYYVGALLMEPDPPFMLSAISSQPLLAGSSDDVLTDADRATINHYKGRVVFPGGAVKLTDGWLLAVGINDCRCGLVKITDLKLC